MQLSRRSHRFELKTLWLTMPDGVRLSATVFLPTARRRGEKFPAVLEMLPYRKDDSMYLRDYPIYSFFARRGYAMVKVDIRGTGSSEGRLPEREYSEQELADAVAVIAQLAVMFWCNGKVGMWGISWGGFNAIQTAMRRPKHLKAILAFHATDDLFHDDVHYIDGVFHVDPYALEIDHENGLPSTPDYKVDGAYFRDRFDCQPWIFAYVKNQRDGDFWRRNSLRFNYEAIDIPVYLIAGLLDGYRDKVPRMLENLRAPVIADVGPWNHTFPDIAVPGPQHDWRERALHFWDRWLKGRRNGFMDGKRLAVFVRSGHAPNANLKNTPGQWRLEDWPIRREQKSHWYATASGVLRRRPSAGSSASSKLALRYVASAGIEAGYWWGEPTGDQRRDDALSLTFDGPRLREAVEIIGMPSIRLRFACSAAQANFVARLEDVHPDGSVSLVTGAAFNGCQSNRLQPEPLSPGQIYDVEFDLHFTTWTFQRGHRIRLAVANAQFPMLWPSPEQMTTTFFVGAARDLCLTLPVIPRGKITRLELLPPGPREMRDDAAALPDNHGLQSSDQNWRPNTETRNVLSDETVVSSGKTYGFRIGRSVHHVKQTTRYHTCDKQPSCSSFTGLTTTTIELPGRKLELHTRMDVSSDATHFIVTFVRRLKENGRTVRTRRWRQRIRRDLQ